MTAANPGRNTHSWVLTQEPSRCSYALRQWALTAAPNSAVRAAIPPACPSRRGRRGRGRAEHPRGRDSASPGMPGRAAVRPTRAGNRARCGSGRYPPHRRRAGCQDAFPAKNLAADDPKQRAAIDDLFRALRHHPGGVIALALARSQLTFGFQLLRDPVLQILDGIAADAKLDQVQHVFRVRLSGRSWPLFDRLLVRSGQSQATDPIPPWRGSSSRLCPFRDLLGDHGGRHQGPTRSAERQLLIRQHSRRGFAFFQRLSRAPPR